MAMGIDGLASGLDTTALITQLMQVEAMPQTLLKSKQTSAQSFVTGLQGLKTRIASLAEVAATSAKPASWSTYQGTSSHPSATVTAGATAQPGTVSLHVDAVARAQVTLTAAVPDDGSLVSAEPPVITIQKKDGTLVQLAPSSGKLADIAQAINDSAEAEVKATVVKVTDGVVPTYRLQLTGATTGTDGSFSLHAGTAAQLTAGIAARLDSATVRDAADATITLWKGTSVEQSYSQSSNTYSGLMTGVDVTVSAVTAPDDDPVTVTVARDDEALAKLASGVVGALGVVLSEITSRTSTTTTTKADGTTSVTGGLFSADSAVRGIRQSLISAASMPVDGFSPSEVGIVLGRDGSFTFDEEKFAAALAADPAKVQSMVTQLSARVSDVATSISDKYDGSLTLKINGQQSMVRDIGSQIESWDRRLDVRRASLERTYSALEVTLSGLQSQSSWLAGQLGSLPSWSNS